MCQNSADRNPKRNRPFVPPSVRHRSADFWPFAHASEWMKRLECLSSDIASNSHVFPARRNRFPVLDHREFVATAVEILRKLSSGSASSVKSGRISLYFPCGSGKRLQRRVRPGLPPPPPSLRLQRLPAYIQRWPEKSTRFRGVWGGGLREPQAETAGWGDRWRHSQRFSLRSIEAVRNDGLGYDAVQ